MGGRGNEQADKARNEDGLGSRHIAARPALSIEPKRTVTSDQGEAMKKRRRAPRRSAAMLGFAVILAMFGRAEAAVPTTPVITSVTPSTTLTPYLTGGCFTVAPCYTLKGHTDKSVKVTVTASDSLGQTVTATTYAAEYTDPWIGVVEGDFSVAPNLTPLGTHDGTDSVITFVAFAENADGKSAVSAPFTITKQSATVGDTTGPQITVGRNEATGFACGTGYCAFDPCLFGSVGGPIWNNPAWNGILLPLRPIRDPIAKGWFDRTGTGCTGRMQVSGGADDATPNSAGKASEIKDVIVTVKDSSGAVVKTVSAMGLRRATQGFWAVSFVVADYEDFESYDWSIVAYDALGNASAPVTGSFTKAPL